MNKNHALKNHTMIEELNKNPQSLFDKRVGHKYGNFYGDETPIGHTYSLILEELAREDLDSSPNAQGFLTYLIERQPYYNKDLTFKKATWVMDVLLSVEEYMKEKGMSSNGQNRVINEVVGPNGKY